MCLFESHSVSFRTDSNYRTQCDKLTLLTNLCTNIVQYFFLPEEKKKHTINRSGQHQLDMFLLVVFLEPMSLFFRINVDVRCV